MKDLGCSDGSVTADGCWLSDPDVEVFHAADVPCRCVNDMSLFRTPAPALQPPEGHLGPGVSPAYEETLGRPGRKAS